jgi:hypothetical protein
VFAPPRLWHVEIPGPDAEPCQARRFFLGPVMAVRVAGKIHRPSQAHQSRIEIDDFVAADRHDAPIPVMVTGFAPDRAAPGQLKHRSGGIAAASVGAARIRDSAGRTGDRRRPGPTNLVQFRRVDPPEADMGSGNLDRIAIDHPRATGELIGGIGSGRSQCQTDRNDQVK